MDERMVRRGDMVEYTLSAHDAHVIADTRCARGLFSYNHHRPVGVMEVCTMLVTAVYDDEAVSGKVFLDGDDMFYVRHARYGEKPGEWCFRE